MNEKHAPAADPCESGYYEIRLKGHLEERWAGWFKGLNINLLADGSTLLSGPVVDQAALHGFLKKVRDLGMPLLSVVCIDPAEKDLL